MPDVKTPNVVRASSVDGQHNDEASCIQNVSSSSLYPMTAGTCRCLPASCVHDHVRKHSACHDASI
jgi:hypothetical protein